MRNLRVFPKRLAPGLAACILTAVMMVGSVSAASYQATPAAGGKAIPPFPSKPVTLQIIDVAGQQQLVQGMIDNYVKANPDKVAKVDLIKDTAPNLPGRIKAQQDA